MANSAIVIEYYEHLIKRSKLVLKGIIEGIESNAEIKRIDDYLFDSYRPLRYDGKEGMEVRAKQSFEDKCQVLRQHGTDPDKISTLAFFQSLASIEKMYDQDSRRNLRPARNQTADCRY
jgi:hypothetical protein